MTVEASLDGVKKALVEAQTKITLEDVEKKVQELLDESAGVWLNSSLARTTLVIPSMVKGCQNFLGLKELDHSDSWLMRRQTINCLSGISGQVSASLGFKEEEVIEVIKKAAKNWLDRIAEENGIKL